MKVVCINKLLTISFQLQVFHEVCERFLFDSYFHKIPLFLPFIFGIVCGLRNYRLQMDVIQEHSQWESYKERS